MRLSVNRSRIPCSPRWLALLTLSLLLVGLLSGCDEQESFACTAEFVMYNVEVLMPDGEPADSVDVTVQEIATGQTYDVCAGISICNDPEDRRYRDPGEYLIFHDGLAASPLGSRVLVIGEKGELAFRAEYIFRQGRCHVQKVSGPERVVLSR
jgi:hypothetical protein